ncbi:hypothetical protein [Lentilactobacillus hilgardii]|uniref:Uncharacterized protein n=1 Tax=Lentilactobacillus hilgardii (strain ATCC 8290 / DSM 20176 / CCUG 30140 / JCM 1155 / KCTC 3500 / NBRC 15886 / NCIMB 8040 / NRRL B-1843 / 9) TaxID=1423757 RepID=C0XGT5_LENH9|nr:hypothetical protein [Lentilactobacillus hilgardii]EEI19564.1 hypothetical protein HMPREF0497_1635 [Lentilactobacillus buchneri ATCC 11577]EEI25406.1 hypothetical protein HMPREF0519_0446 [Lentilactobacillus hilgardii DSM 20176 = ATCC 8290]KRK56856.1 hypothetical protein FD42_GL002591 [Lentilactobacillus hilgardii DSM 20176 = ATCC 8290]MCP9333457.1 hypothetical protein [Lentilactobacillus hilgardii]MCP9349986.1 hypothetical protein [Lentilactobacillus hilgardii]
MAEEAKINSKSTPSKEDPIKEPKLNVNNSGKYIVGNFKIWDPKSKENITYVFKFPGYEKAVGFMDLIQSGNRAYWGALMRGNEALDLPQVIQNPTSHGETKKMGWAYWDDHKKLATVLDQCDTFLQEQLD